jgi:hypothetical protein
MLAGGLVSLFFFKGEREARSSASFFQSSRSMFGIATERHFLSTSLRLGSQNTQ